MNEYICDLIEKLEPLLQEGTAPEAAEAAILRETEDPEDLLTLAPDRIGLLDSFPWSSDLEVLQIGACEGAFAPLAGRVRRWTIMDSEEELQLCRMRFPELCAGEASQLVLLRPQEAGTASYDVVVLVLAGGVPRDEEEPVPEEAVRRIREAAAFVRPGGTLIAAADNAGALAIAAGEMPESGRLYMSLSQVRDLQKTLPFGSFGLYYPLPEAGLATGIFSDARLPGEGDFKGIASGCRAERYSMYSEETVYTRLSKAGVFPEFAPSYLMVFGDKDLEAQGQKPAFAPPLYTRYNRRRAPELQIRTEILEDAAGKRKVRKTAMTGRANAHIEAFAERYKELLASAGTGIEVLEPAIGTLDGGLAYAEFPYIEGRDLGRVLAEQIRGGRAPEQEISRMLDRILGGPEQPCRNLDALFENIMVQEDPEGPRYTLLDYEWVFPEDLGRRFVRWRILSYWYAACREQLYAYPDPAAFFRAFGLEPEELAGFEEKEAAFQAYVRGEQDDPVVRFRKTPKTPAQVRAQEERLAEFTEWNLRLQDEIEEHKTALSKEREVERLSQNHIRNIEKINAARAAEIERMNGELQYLRKHQSLLSRLFRGAVDALDSWAPAESRKRKMIHLIKNTVLHPVRQCRLYLTPEGRDYIAGDFQVGGEFAEGGILTLPETKEPLVSVVIPAYNQVAYTYACIRSILEHTDFAATPCEVILADDVSTDATREISRYIRGLVISRNSSNMGFLKNCNQAAAKARGRYIFFLNNDTKVHDGWLESLVRLMEEDPSIGMTGSKLVYPDGRLQEAGGIIWSDASGWNYGRLDDPDKPEYNYVKDVDYISGAAIMIRKELWQEIGGFDERFAPAYCEDSDLAFEVRRHGRRVVYQPLSVVTHFEGISNGTDVTGTGLKRYQVINQETFKAKWAEELKKQAVNTGNPDPFRARERSLHKPCVVVIDHYVPTWDKDAGSRTTFQYIRMFLKKGFSVKFVGDNFLHEEPYSGILQQMGVEILYGPEYQNNILEWFRKNSDNIDFCYLNRPHIAVKYIDFLKEHTSIRCIFYGHDLHYLRLFREYELTGEIRKKRESDYWKSVEFSVMEKADMVYYPSETEIAAIHHFHPEIKARAITAYVWDAFPEAPHSAEEYSRRHDLLFVGGFRHPPNADGVRWFVEKIWPRIREKQPELRFLIAGSGADEEILALADAAGGIEVLGFVSDERLEELYREARLVVVPLRYGAGVKGKVVEAAYHNCAIVTTSVGAEGIPEAASCMAVTDADPEKLQAREEEIAERFADEVLRLSASDEDCALLSSAAAAMVRRHYSTDAAWDKIREDWQTGSGTDPEADGGRP